VLMMIAIITVPAARAICRLALVWLSVTRDIISCQLGCQVYCAQSLPTDG